MTVQKQLDRLEFKMDRVCDKIEDVKETLSHNGAVLEEHQRRSLALEKQVSLLDRHFNRVLGAFIILQVLVPFFTKYLF